MIEIDITTVECRHAGPAWRARPSIWLITEPTTAIICGIEQQPTCLLRPAKRLTVSFDGDAGVEHCVKGKLNCEKLCIKGDCDGGWAAGLDGGEGGENVWLGSKLLCENRPPNRSSSSASRGLLAGISARGVLGGVGATFNTLFFIRRQKTRLDFNLPALNCACNVFSRNNKLPLQKCEQKTFINCVFHLNNIFFDFVLLYRR